MPDFIRRLLLIRKMAAPLAAVISMTAPADAEALGQGEPDYAGTMRRIAEDIGRLRREFPQLREFSVKADLHGLDVGYSYRTHRSKIRVGWRAGAPEPDRDGVWFYINLHDPDSAAQIDTQPMSSGLCFGGKRVTFLLLEGAGTKPLGARLGSILAKNGVQPCQEPQTPR